MSEEKKKEIKEVVDTIKQLDKSSLTIIKTGAEMLRARQMLENTPSIG